MRRPYYHTRSIIRSLSCLCRESPVTFHEIDEAGQYRVIQKRCQYCSTRSNKSNRPNVTYSYPLPVGSPGRYVLGIGELRRQAPDSLNNAHNSTFVESSTKCRILDLPDEILLQIVRQSVPSQTSFHIFPARMEHVKARPIGTSVHAFRQRPAEPVASTDELGSVNCTALASTCRRFKELYYTVVYGENHFTFELATVGLAPQLFGSLPESGIDCRISVFERSPDTLWPLSSGSAKYLKELTLLVSITSKATWKARNLLRERFQEMIRLFPADHILKRLTIDVRKVPESPFFQIERLGWNVYGKDDFILRLKYPVQLHADCDMHAKFRESLGELQNVEDLLLSVGPNSNTLEALLAYPKVLRPRKKRRLY